MRVHRFGALALAAAMLGACSLTSRGSATRGADELATRAGTALQLEAFATAREDLLALAADCASGSRGRDALLLLAAAEIDTGNAGRSPALAAYFAGSYLLLPDAEPADLPIARALYRVGMDLSRPAGGVQALESPPPVAPRFEACRSGDPSTALVRTLPTTPAPTAARLDALRQTLSVVREALSARSDSLAEARASFAAASARMAELEAELERIRQLLTSGLDAYPRRHRP